MESLRALEAEKRGLCWETLLSAALLSAIAFAGSGEGVHKRKIPCKIPANAASCYWTHGRLGYSNGTPEFRLWKIGTMRMLGIYGGPSVAWTMKP